ncbi:putative inactive leucine-rich repeat receptor-like protein kinase isoform X1 [Cinnamomum micranthum f. kanehirae]|uniref:Putative inactive leucine-rich repeat receptor-like protein kinase isoform X1 n=1 Tax=Cinnamomum micranthum f. kanehirae TaxID=337451 RepID=A0A443P3Q4_9MAGN|nr:putative inactive leucine-rich repeat receptor-like protein kinase isoform X1 [Cinnamomum micranthum f. kanehirae]
MAERNYPSSLLIFSLVFLWIPFTCQLESSEVLTLLQIKKLLNSPDVLSTWDGSADFCNTEPNSSLTVGCYEGSITQLHIISQDGSPMLPRNFSIDSFFTTLVKLPSLKVLSLVSLGLWGPLPAKISRLSSLEILNVSSNFLYGSIPGEVSTLKNLQTLILDYNMFSGRVPDWLSELPVLAVLSLRNNSFTGSLPNSLGSLENLRVLSLSRNRLYGEVPDLSNLINLQVLDLEDNYFGPHFPSLGSKVVALVLRNNRFSSSIPSEASSYIQLQRLDISFNRFVGPFSQSLLSLPSLNYLNIAGNRFTGMLYQNTSCNEGLGFVDLSSNLLTGSLPSCLESDSKMIVVRYANNCLTSKDQNQHQHPYAFCRNEALAVVGILRSKQKKVPTDKVSLPLSIVGGVVGGGMLVGILIWLILRKVNVKRAKGRPPRRLIAESASTGFPSKLLSDGRYIISQTMRLGALGLPPYQTFSLEELEKATNNFETSTFIGEGSHGQMYRGKLSDGSVVAIRCLKLKERHSIQNFVHHIELISKLRHRHLVSALGHCFECYLDDSSVSRLFLVFEYISYGTLRSNISGSATGQTLSWTRRIAAAIGVAKGIQFLHTGIVPGVLANNLKTTSILLDQNLVAKISSYDLPILEEIMRTEPLQVGTGVSWSGSKEPRVPVSTKHEDKMDVYDFGVILLEIIVGRPITSLTELRASVAADESARRSIADPAVQGTSLDESLKTVMEICVRCLSKEPTERPSVEDVLWNLQFAAQVQDSSRGDSQSSEGSPISRPQASQLQLSIQ